MDRMECRWKKKHDASEVVRNRSDESSFKRGSSMGRTSLDLILRKEVCTIILSEKSGTSRDYCNP